MASNFGLHKYNRLASVRYQSSFRIYFKALFTVSHELPKYYFHKQQVKVAL